MINKKILILAALLTLLMSCAKKIEPEIHLIPEGYIGSLYVIYDVRQGLKPEYEEGVRLYRYSDQGVTHTQFPLNKGMSYPGMIRFFYISKDGSRKEITDIRGSGIEDSEKNRNDKRLYLISMGFGEFGFNEETTSRGCKYTDRSFYIGTLLNALEGVGNFQLKDYYLKYEYPCP